MPNETSAKRNKSRGVPFVRLSIFRSGCRNRLLDGSKRVVRVGEGLLYAPTTNRSRNVLLFARKLVLAESDSSSKGDFEQSCACRGDNVTFFEYILIQAYRFIEKQIDHENKGRTNLHD